MEPVELIADDLLIRPWRTTDATAVHRACQDPEIPRWTPVPSPYLTEHAQGFVTTHNTRVWATGTGASFGIFDLDSGELLGFTGLVRLDLAAKTAEIGYWTAPWARGRGVSERGSRAIAHWAFHALGVRRIDWRATVGNHASLLVALRIGVRVEGIARSSIRNTDGTVEDCWVGSLLPNELTPPGAAGPARTGSIEARRAAIFGRPQPTLPFTTSNGTGQLRAPQHRDLDDIVASCHDPESIRWTTVPLPYQHDDAIFFVTTHSRRLWDRGNGAVFAITGPDDRYAGSMELRISPEDPALADVGFLVSPWARGRGYCPAALRAMSQWGCAELGLSRIEWRAYVGNQASRRAAEKAGFTIEGVQRARCVHRGQRRDSWVGSLMAQDLL